jgi:heat shock protein HslJ
MKKTSVTIITLIILIVAGVLTYISKTSEEVTVDNPPVTVVIKDFEGEANPDIMKLDMKTWTWVSITYNDGTVIKPKITDKFKLTFKGKTFSATTDCNGIGGEFITNQNKIFLIK